MGDQATTHIAAGRGVILPLTAPPQRAVAAVALAVQVAEVMAVLAAAAHTISGQEVLVSQGKVIVVALVVYLAAAVAARTALALRVTQGLYIVAGLAALVLRPLSLVVVFIAAAVAAEVIGLVLPALAVKVAAVQVVRMEVLRERQILAAVAAGKTVPLRQTIKVVARA